jgi:hypothetical protein
MSTIEPTRPPRNGNTGIVPPWLQQPTPMPPTPQPADQTGKASAGSVILLTFMVAALAIVTIMLSGPSSADAHGSVAPRMAYHHNWIRVAHCESGGRWALNTGNGYYGGLQFSKRTWDSVNRSGYAWPHRAPAWVQIGNANRLKARAGIGQWPHCGRYW